MKFFTDKTVINPYLLIKIEDFIKIREKNPKRLSKYREIFIDPGVCQLKKSPKFIWEERVDVVEFLDSLKENEYFSYDYLVDMNEKFTDHFLQRTWDNACHYCYHPQYIVTVQSRFKDYFNFIKWFDRYNALDIKSGIMGLGNICRIHHLTEYIKHFLSYAFAKCRYSRIHVYGLGMRIIKYAYNLAKKYDIELSIDSTKWTRCVNQELKGEYGVNCSSKNRQIFFNTYINTLRDRGMKVNLSK